MTDIPKTTLIFFGSRENSKYGTLRSMIALTLIILVLFIIKLFHNEFYDSLINRKIGLILAIVVIISAITVQVPTGVYDAMKYGASVGAFLSVISAVALSSDFNTESVLFVITSTFITSIISVIVYKISNNINWYPFEPC
jgi:beta-lactamase regulating signal transducer with metallopeptidase domain